MNITYYFVEVIQGIPVLEKKTVTEQEFETEYHPDKIKENYLCIFADIEIECCDEDQNIKENEEVIFLNKTLELSFDTMEEICTDQRPRLDNYLEFTFILFKAMKNDPKEKDEKIEFQVGMKVYDNLLISIHNKPNIFSEITLFRNFERNPNALLHGEITYMICSYFDVLIDLVLSSISNWRKYSAILEKEILKDPKISHLDDLIDLRGNLLDTEYILRADMEVINKIEMSDDGPFMYAYIPPELNDHIQHSMDETNIMRSLISDLISLFYSSEQRQLSYSLARLTFFTALFLVPNLVAGIFGMNTFKGYPDIHFLWPIFILICTMIFLYVFFKWKKLI